jgi:iron-sulfur cluster insertion protein
MITISATAVQKLKEISESEGIGHLVVRLRVQGGGCSGFEYDMSFEDVPTDMDESFEQDGITVVIDPLSMQYLEGVEIEYLEGLMSSGFKFINPNVKSTCGCGSSFGV